MLKRLLMLIVCAVIVAACGSDDNSGTPIAVAEVTEENIQAILADLPEGDAANGEELFDQRINSAPACTGCHQIDTIRRVGPGLAGYADRAATTVDGQDAAEYTYNAIVNPASYLVEGYPNVMHAGYGNDWNDQQIADIIAYLLSLS